jgi:hypothetical protein
MASIGAIEKKIQISISPEVMDTETNSVTAECKEEKSAPLTEMKKYKSSYLDKKLAASFAEAFNAFCFAPFVPEAKKISLFLFLGRIPSDILLNYLLPFLALESNPKDYYSLLRLEKPISLLFQKHLPDIHLTQLLQHVAFGEKWQAEKIIKAKPQLLLLKGPIVKNYAGFEIQQTAYQMALMAGDVFVKFKNGVYQPDAKGEEIKEMIERYLIEFLGEEKGIAEIERQKNEVCPGEFKTFEENFAVYLKEKNKKDSQAVKTMFQAIANAKATTEEDLIIECNKDLKEFKTWLEPKDVITTGIHFNALTLVSAHEEFDANYLLFGNHWESPKNVFAWQKVVGLVQRYLNTCDAMVLCQGPNDLVQNGEPFERRLTFTHGNVTVFFPLDSDPKADGVLGKNCAVAGWEGADSLGACAAGGALLSLEILMSSKNIVVAKGLCNAQAIVRRLSA